MPANRQNLRRNASTNSTLHRAKPRERHGSALVAAVVAFAVVSTVLFSVLKGTIDQQRQMRAHRLEVQSDWLAAAGVDRAIARLQQSANYNGEIWEVPADQLGDTAPARVTINVEPAAKSSQRQISVQADYPADTAYRSRKSRTATIQLP
jgi:hypothetical protein